MNVLGLPSQRTLQLAAADAPRPGPRALDDLTVAELGNREAQALFGFVRRLGLTDAQADDAVQEVLLRLLGQLRDGSEIRNPRAWAYRSIYRIAMDEHRLQRRWFGLLRRSAPSSVPAGPALTDQIAVWTEVDRLSPRQRDVIYLRYRSDLTFDEIADTLGITASAARSHATQAVQALQRRLDDQIEDR